MVQCVVLAEQAAHVQAADTAIASSCQLPASIWAIPREVASLVGPLVRPFPSLYAYFCQYKNVGLAAVIVGCLSAR